MKCQVHWVPPPPGVLHFPGELIWHRPSALSSQLSHSPIDQRSKQSPHPSFPRGAGLPSGRPPNNDFLPGPLARGSRVTWGQWRLTGGPFTGRQSILHGLSHLLWAEWPWGKGAGAPEKQRDVWFLSQELGASAMCPGLQMPTPKAMSLTHTRAG